MSGPDRTAGGGGGGGEGCGGLSIGKVIVDGLLCKCYVHMEW